MMHPLLSCCSSAHAMLLLPAICKAFVPQGMAHPLLMLLEFPDEIILTKLSIDVIVPGAICVNLQGLIVHDTQTNTFLP